jgi:LDH2 family malate/lactate/ureidoglycolate dehydrogenase|tara:strand:+ start:416 stop:1462 length:1047 start_codon:yes stop_codon:yes gene_type:complete
MKLIFYDDLRLFHQKILTAAGLDDFSSNSVTSGLCETSLRGVDSHGIRLLPHYVESALSGRKNPQPSFQFRKKFPALGVLDADNAFGHAAGMKAIEHCIEMADVFGMGAVAVNNSSHAGAMASMALRAAREGYIAFAFTHADSLLLSHNGERPYFGTNPVCVAAPREEQEPFCLDMATSMISWNKLMVYKSEGIELPENFAADSMGNMTCDPDKTTCLIPAGSYKGYGLASMVEVLCGVFTGMNFGRDIPGMYTAPMNEPRRLGQFYMVIRADGCIEQEQFMKRMQELTDQVRKEPAVDGTKVMLSGDPEIEESKRRLKEGIPIDITTLLEFERLSEKFNVPLQLIDS